MDPATPNAPFRWEAASGLEHSCFSCKMKMSNPKARQTCYGIHSIPCYRYHQTMHAIGTSHKCCACVQSDELHENRHRRIAELVAEYKSTTGGDGGQLSRRPRVGLEELPVNIPRALYARHRPDNERYDGDENEGENDDDESVTESVTESVAESFAESITDTTTSDNMSGPPKLTKAETRAAKKAAKAAKSQNKAFKNQSKHTISVRTKDVEAVNKILHGDTANAPATHPLASDKTIEEVIQRNSGFMSSIEEHKKQLMSSIAQRRKNDKERRRTAQAQRDSKKRRFSSVSLSHDEEFDEEGEEMEILLTAVLTKLGIAADHIKNGAAGCASGNGKKGGAGKSASANAKAGCCSSNGTSANRLSIVANLKALVKDDLEKFENDQRETCIRAGGFWRYVGRPVFERMTKIAEELDWKTGVKLKERSGEE